MASRGSAIQRFLRYVREADVDEMRVALQLAKEIAERRLAQASQVPPNPAKAKRTRKSRVLSPAEHTAMTASTKAIKDNQETLADA